MFEGFREFIVAQQAAKEIADKFMGEPKEEPYSKYTLYTEPVTNTKVYHAMGADQYDLVIPHGELSLILRKMPWILSHLAFHGVDTEGSVFIEFSQRGPWRECTTEMFGNVFIFDDVWPKKIDNFEACERVEQYRQLMEQIIKDTINEIESQKARKKKDRP